MEINIEEVKLLIRERFRNNKTWFAEEIGVDRSYISQITCGKRSASSQKVIKGIISYCKKNKLNYKKYINF